MIMNFLLGNAIFTIILYLQVPEVRTIVCPHGFDHAFNLRSSQQMATLVCDWIQTQAAK